MLINKIKNITIFGGGASGWMAAAFLANNLRLPVSITLIEDPDFNPIGVGEGTQPFTAAFLRGCGLEPKEWMKPSKASYKWGVELVGWTKDPYFVDNDHFVTHAITEKLCAHDYFLGRGPTEFFDWLPPYRIAKKNLSPRFGDNAYHIGAHVSSSEAVHFSAADIIDTLKNITRKRINFVEAKIEKIETDSNGIKNLITNKGEIYTADLFIDCTGFSSKLIEKTLNVPFNSYEEVLPCNRAVAIPTQYNNPYTECHPYTKATTMKNGWRWTIPNFERIGNGYVYSDKYCTPEEAEEELREILGEYEAPARHLKMRCGKMEKIAYKNVCAVGLSAGFIEPLEATGITFTTKVVEWLTNALNNNNFVWNENVKGEINGLFDYMSAEVFAFIWCHYYFSDRKDTDFWKKIKNTPVEEFPQIIHDVLKEFVPYPQGSFFLSPTSMFHKGQWASMFIANNRYNTLENHLKEDDEKFLEYSLRVADAQATIAENYFPNHYSYLEKWYNEE